MSAPAEDRDAYRVLEAVRSIPECGICEGDRLHESADGSVLLVRRFAASPLLTDSRLSVIRDTLQPATPRLTVSRGGAS